MAPLLVSRPSALAIMAYHLRVGAPMHPKLRARLREIIGETTPEEEAGLRSARLAGEAELERSREQLQVLAKAARATF